MYCAIAVDSMPNESETIKYFSLDYSPLLSILFAVIVFPLTILMSVLAVGKLFRKEGNLIEKHRATHELVAYVVIVLVFVAVAVIGGVFYKELAIKYDYGQHCFSDLNLDNAISSAFSSSMGYLVVYMLAVFALFFPFGMVMFSAPAFCCNLIRHRRRNTEQNI